MSGDFQVTTPGEFRAKNSFPLKVSERLSVIRRKTDPVELIFSGILQLPALNAAQKFEDIRKVFDEAGNQEKKEKAANDFLSGKEKDDLLDMLRKFACENVISPRIVMEQLPAGDTSAICVKELEFIELLVIFNAEGPEAAVESPVKSSAQIEEFRRPEPAPAGDAGRVGEEVRAEAKLIPISPERDVIFA